MKALCDTRIYKVTERSSIYADIYYHGSRTPVIIYLHSGALIFGTRKWLPTEQIELYKNAGFSVISMDYRLAPETKFESIIEDIQEAVNWVRTTASQLYDYDTSKIAMIGCSAGAYLCLVCGTMGWRPDCIVSFYGYGDILGDWLSEPSEYYCSQPVVQADEARMSLHNGEEISEGSWDRFRYYLWCRQQGVWLESVTGMERGIDVERLRKYNPIDNITQNFPPTLFLHGDQDTDVPYEQSTAMYEALRESGVQTDLITIHGADHVFDQHYHDPQVQQAFERTIDFLQQHLTNRS
jgi:acetyl esterase/lipase